MAFDLQKVGALAIYLHGTRIGVINRLGGDQHIFAFLQDYIDDPNRPTLSLSFREPSGELITAVRPVRTKVPPFFSNLLPEGHLRSYLAERAGVKPEREFFLLAMLGADLPGAINVMPLEGNEPIEVSYDSEEKNDGENSKSQALRFSLAGVQLKFSAIMEDTGGLTIPVDGMGGSWIVKLPSFQHHHVPENEYVMLELARAIGISTPNTKLLHTDEIQGLPENAGQPAGRALAVERFDRSTHGERVHMEDFAQVFGLFPNDKYENNSYSNIGFTLWTESGEENAYEFVKRLVFSVLIGNADMHLKNWSLLYPNKQKPVLSPAYDFVSTVPYIPEDKLALTFGGSRSLKEITKDQVRRFADTARMPVSPIWQIVKDTTEHTANVWKSLNQRDLLPTKINNIIDEQINTVAANIAKQ